MKQDETMRPWYTIDELNAWADEKEKQAWRNAAIRLGEELASVGPYGYYNMKANEWLDWAMANVKSQIEFAPVKMVAYNCTCGKTMKFESDHGVIAPKREWVGLTDDEMQDCLNGLPTQTIDVYARRIEAKLKEKNT